MSGIQSYKDLKIWQKGISLVKLIYKSCESFPKELGFVTELQYNEIIDLITEESKMLNAFIKSVSEK